MLKKNIGNGDRLIRFILALLCFVLAFWLKSWLLGLVGLFTLYEALASWCVLYQLMGKNSCPLNRQDEDKKP